MRAIVRRLSQDANLKDLLRNSGILYAGGLVSLALTFIQQISTAKLLGADDYGRLAIVLSSGLLIMLVIDFRTWEIGTKLLTHSHSNGDTIETARVTTWLMMLEILTGIIGVCVIIALAPLIANQLLKIPELAPLVAIYAIAIPFRLLSGGILSVFPRIYGRFDWLAWKSIIYSLARLILMSGAALAGFGLAGVLLGAIIGELINFGLLVLMAARLYAPSEKGARFFDFGRPKQFIEGRQMMGQLWVSSTLASLQYQMFIPIMALLTTPAQIGLFRSALDIGDLLERTIQPISIVFTPRIISIYNAGSIEAFKRYLRQCALILVVIVLPIVVSLLLVGPYIIPVFLGSDFIGIVEITNVIVIGAGIHAILQWWLRPAAIATQTLYEQNVALFILVFISLGLMFIFIPVLGAMGAALIKAGYLSSYALSIAFLFYRHHWDFPNKPPENGL